MADTLSLYKLIILKMLEQVEYPLTNSSDHRIHSGQRIHQLFHRSAGTLRDG